MSEHSRSTGAKRAIVKVTFASSVLTLFCTFLGSFGLSPAADAAPSAPGPPQILNALPRNSAALVSWLAPSSNGGSQITRYTVVVGETHKCITTGGLQCEVTGLTNGKGYGVYVTATNAAGTSRPSRAATVQPGTPGPIAHVTASWAASGAALVQWSAPYDSGFPILRYAIGLGSPPPTDPMVTTRSTSAAFDGLTDGDGYYFYVTATNIYGTSRWAVSKLFLASELIVNGCSIFPHANLTGCDFTGAILTNLDLTDTTLANVTLTDADLSGDTLTGVSSGGITGTPVALPTGWLLASGYLVGPGAILTNASLSGANLAGADLEGTQLSGAVLSEVSSGGVIGSPSSLPTGWLLADGYLVGPQANLTNANLADAALTNSDLDGTDLSGADLSGVSSGGITGLPASLPSDWSLFNGYLVGPSANLASADLSREDLGGADLSNVDLTNASLDDSNLATADLSGVTWSNTTCPDGSNSNADGDTCDNDLGFSDSDSNAQQNLDATLSIANSIYTMNHESFPTTASLISSLVSADPSLTFTHLNSFNASTISVSSSADLNGIILAAYSPITGNCWYIYANRAEVVDFLPYGPVATGQTPVYLTATTSITVPSATGTYYAEAKGDNRASDCYASQPVAAVGSEYLFQSTGFPNL